MQYVGKITGLIASKFLYKRHLVVISGILKVMFAYANSNIYHTNYND